MWIRLIGAAEWRGALLRWLAALLLPWAALWGGTELTARFAASSLSTDHLLGLKAQIASRSLYTAAANLPVLAFYLGTSLLLGGLLVLLFRRHPLRVALAACAALLLYLLPLLFDALTGQTPGGDLAIALHLFLPVAAGLLLPAWWPRRARAAAA